MTTLENKRNDIITLAKGAEVDTYVPQVHVYNMIDIYVMNRNTGCRVQGGLIAILKTAKIHVKTQLWR